MYSVCMLRVIFGIKSICILRSISRPAFFCQGRAANSVELVTALCIIITYVIKVQDFTPVPLKLKVFFGLLSLSVSPHMPPSPAFVLLSRVQLKCDDTWRRRGGEVKGKLAKEVGSLYSSHYLGTWCIQHYYHYCR